MKSSIHPITRVLCIVSLMLSLLVLSVASQLSAAWANNSAKPGRTEQPAKPRAGGETETGGGDIPGNDPGDPSDPPVDPSDETGSGSSGGSVEPGLEMSIDQTSGNTENTDVDDASESRKSADEGSTALWDEILKHLGGPMVGDGASDQGLVGAAVPVGPSLTPDEEAAAITNGWQ